MATVLGTTLEVAQIYAPRTDRAFAVNADGAAAALRRYSATRHPADLARVPLREGRTPRLYGVRMLTAAELSALQPHRGLERSILACRVGVTFARSPEGSVERATMESEGTVKLATMEWIEKLQAIGGVQLLVELGEIIQRRAEIGDIDPEDYPTAAEGGGDPLDLYAAPSGLKLPR